MSDAPLLEVRDLELRIGSVTPVRGCSFAVTPGERVALIGRNGVGKSTLLAALAGLHPLRQGEIRCGGTPLADWDACALARRRGWLPQHPEDPFATSVLEAVLVGRHPWLGRFSWEGPEDLQIARAALAAMDLTGFETRSVTTLSGGERQRVALAALLAQAPQLYLLDEPLTHLDLSSQVAVLAHWRGLAEQGAAVLMVAHDLNLALRWCSRVLILFGDGDWAEGPVELLATPRLLSRAVGHPLRRLEDESGPVFLPA